MSVPDNFIITPSHAEYRPVGQVTFPEALALMCAALAYAREAKVRKLLINKLQLGGFGPLTTLERFQLGKECATAAAGSVVAALVTEAESIDPQRFGVTVARNRAMQVEVFTDEPTALAWLLATEPNVEPERA